MPTHPPKACTQPGCKALVYEMDQSKCQAHRRNRASERQRPSAALRGYDARWRKIRDAKLKETPYCEDPFQAHHGRIVLAHEVDHIVPLNKGGTRANKNLQSLCGLCHRRKTNKEDGGGWRGRGM